MRAVNLLPREQPRRARAKAGRGVKLAVVAAVVVAAALGAAYLIAVSRVDERRATLQTLQEQLAALPPPAQAPAVDQTLVSQHDLRVIALGAALKSRVAWDRILSQISAVLPEDVWLTTLAAQSPEAPASSPAGTATAAAPLALDGYTYSQEGVARFLSRLAVIPELEDVKLQQSELTPLDGRVVVKFELTAQLRAEASG
jgi:Tfp pilus assembly protein PilN